MRRLTARRAGALLAGPLELGHGRAFWTITIVVIVGLVAYPLVGSVFMISNLADFLVYVPMSLGLCLLWGYGGILSFGQSAFFGISGYVFGIVAGNLVGSTGGTLFAAGAAIISAAMVAAALGYFLFYGEVSGWIVPLLLLVVSLILETFMGQTAGYEWRVGSVLLGGYNGMTGIPSIQVGPITFGGADTAFYYLVLGIVLIAYFGLRCFLNSYLGHVIIGLRDDAQRTRMLGYNVPFIQVQIFVLAAALAAVSGVLYASWGNYMNPSSMNMLAATLPVIWTAVGGRTSLTAVLLATLALRWFADTLSVWGGQYAFLIMGVLLLGVMLFFPDGIVVGLARWWNSLGDASRRQVGRARP